MVNLFIRWLVAAFAFAGIVVSVLALRVHNMDPGLAPPCAVSEKFDCGTVNHSRYAVFPARTFDEAPGTRHIPVAILGIAGYSVLCLLALFGRLRVVAPLAIVGFCFAAYLTWLEAHVIQKWCIYCLWSQGLIAAVMLFSILGVILQRRSVKMVYA